jgi:hypothetical protein
VKRHNTFLTIIAASAVLAACGTAPDNPAENATATVAPASPEAGVQAMGPAPTYKFPANLCAVIDFGPFIAVQPGVPRTQERRRTAGARSASSTCVATLGMLPGGLIVMTGLEIFTDARTGQAQFEGFKGINVRDHPDSRSVTGVGDAAYFYTDRVLGPTLVARHGTALVDVSVSRVGQAATIPADAQQRLTQLVQQLLTALPRA